MQLKLLDIYVGKRRRVDLGDIEDLAEDMRKTGQITAITVRKPNDEDLDQNDYQGETWVLVAGGRRYTAALRNGWEEIASHDMRDLTPLEHRVAELNENLKRKDMTWHEIAEAKQQMLAYRREQEPTITQAQVAREIGETPANFSRDIKVAEAITARPELKQQASKKGALRMAEAADHFTARVQRENPKLALDLRERLVTADMREWLRSLEPSSVDLCIPDLPYGYDVHDLLNKEARGSVSDYDDTEDTTKDLIVDVVPQMIRVTKRTGWICCFMSEEHYDFVKRLLEECCVVHCEYRMSGHSKCMAAAGGAEGDCEYGHVQLPRWIWYRPNSMNNPRYPETHAKSLHEQLVVFRMPEARLMRPCGNVLVYDSEYQDRLHILQKPVELLKDLISRFTLAGERVIDPCFGSGAHMEAAAALQRDFRGCELNPGLLEPALGKVSRAYSGVAPRMERTDTTGLEEFEALEDDTSLEEVEDDAAVS